MARVIIIGTKGVPNRYGGFERLVEVLAPYLADRGHSVTVICESPDGGGEYREDQWHGVRRVFLPRNGSGAFATLNYDLRSFLKAQESSIALIFGYGTSIFQKILEWRGIPHCVNMDGIEWRREKWGKVARAWLHWNERYAARHSDVLIADHPEIQRYLVEAYSVQSVMIPYGVTEEALALAGRDGGVSVGDGEPYYLLVARPEPENQVHVVLDAFRKSRRRARMLVVGNYEATKYGRDLIGDYGCVEFMGPLYSEADLNDLRRRCELYFHGHSVGGTNPSLIEAMAAGAPVCAHDNIYNRWVLGSGGMYFETTSDLVQIMNADYSDSWRTEIVAKAREQCRRLFLWSEILVSYEKVVQQLESKVGTGKHARTRLGGVRGG